MSFSSLCLVGCQTPTQVSEKDLGEEERVFSRISSGEDVELKRSVIVDVRSRFDHEMSRLPRSFYAYWKDWDLSGYSGQALDDKRRELQRLLALQGIDPLTQVVILGPGLKGEGEEFLLASTLFSLGIERISFMNSKQVQEALVSRDMPRVENAPAWEKPLQGRFTCGLNTENENERLEKADIIVSEEPVESQALVLKPTQVFHKNLQVKKRSYPKGMRVRIYSPDSLWAYGLALYFKSQGRSPCVLTGPFHE